jgi:hypothetical protein
VNTAGLTLLGSQPSLGVYIGLPITLILALGCGAVLVFAPLIARWWDVSILAPVAGGAAAAAVVAVVFVLSWFPFSGEYHQWTQLRGTVAQSSSRLVGADNSTSQRFVVAFKGNQGQFSCDDTRCSLVHPGDVLTLSCKRSWQYVGTSGYDCNYVDDRGGTQ